MTALTERRQERRRQAERRKKIDPSSGDIVAKKIGRTGETVPFDTGSADYAHSSKANPAGQLAQTLQIYAYLKERNKSEIRVPVFFISSHGD